MTQYLLALEQKNRTNLRSMFDNDWYREDWLKRVTSRPEFEAFLRQLHYEDSNDPCGKGYGSEQCAQVWFIHGTLPEALRPLLPGTRVVVR